MAPGWNDPTGVFRLNPLLEELTFPSPPLPRISYPNTGEPSSEILALKERPRFSFADRLEALLDSPHRPDVRTALRILAREFSS